MIIVKIRCENAIEGLKERTYQIEQISLHAIDKLVDDFEERFTEYEYLKKEIYLLQ